MLESKWDREEIFFQEIDLSPLKQGKPAKTFKYSDESKTTGYAASIFKSKKTGKYYIKVEVVKKKSEETGEIRPDESFTDEDIPF